MRSSALTSGSTVPRSSPITKAPCRLASMATMSSSSWRREADVATAAPDRPPGGDPVLAEQPHHVVDAQPAGVRRARPARPPGRARSRAARSFHGTYGGRPQSWPFGTELVRRRADAAGERQQVLVAPGVEAVRRRSPTARSCSTSTPAPSDAGPQLLVDQPLAPGVEAQAVRADAAAASATAAAVRTAQLVGPRPPATARAARPARSTGVHRSSERPCAARQRRKGSPAGVRSERRRRCGCRASIFSRSTPSRSRRGARGQRPARGVERRQVRRRPGWRPGTSATRT